MIDPVDPHAEDGPQSPWAIVGSALYRFLTRLRSIIAVTVIGFAVLGVYGYYVDRNLEAAHNENLESSIWVIGQIEPRALIFQLALERHLADQSDVDLREQLELQAELLISRIDIVDNHLRNSGFQMDDDLRDTWRQLLRRSGQIERLLDPRQNVPGTSVIAEILLEDMERTHDLIRDFNVKSMALAVTRQSDERLQLRHMSQQFAVISFFLIGVLLLAILFLFRNAAKLSSRGRELRNARDAAVQAAEARSRFFAVMSHEMRTPITGAIAAIDALRITTHTNEGQRRLASIADRSARMALEQINNVLDLAWLEQGDDPDTFVTFNVTDAIEDLIDQVRPMADRHGNEIELELPDREDAFVLGPQRIFMRPLQNLLGNALKFNVNGTITVRAAIHSGRLRVEVEDDGEGISEDLLEKIFEPFEQGGDGKTRGNSGNGLGLVIARQAVEGMNGKLGVSSSPGCGANFWFNIPIEQVSFEERPRHVGIQVEHGADEPFSPRLSKHSILLVEDDDPSRMIAAEILRHFGQDVTEAVDGEEAVELAQSHHFDLIFMDVSMPRLNGEGATRKIRENSLCRDTPIIGVTAFGSADELSSFKSCGMDRVLPKPLTSRMILDVFSKNLDCPVPKLGSQALSEGVSEESLNQAMSSLRTEVSRIIADLPHCPGKDCRRRMSDEVHRTKGLASVLGQSGLVEVLGALNDVLENAPGRVIDDMVERLKAEYEKLPSEEGS